jgi:tetratricopeptide (TPR) repeat protein
MSTKVLVTSAVRYAEAFYHALATGTPISMAHEQAQWALHDDPRRHLQRRHQDEAGTFVELDDWWMPHLYQQQSVFLQPTQPVSRRKKHQTSPVSYRLNEEMPGELRYGFFGRARELLALERWVRQGKVIVISGFGGIGKTALAREAADWLTRTKMYDGACFVSFEHGGDAIMLLSTLGHYLRIYDGHYNPDDRKAALARLGSIFQRKRTLVIADNLESILPGGEAPLEPEIRTQLWDVFFELAQMGVGVLLTSRDTALGDDRFVPSSRVAFLSLQGLRPNDAYALAIYLLNELEIDRVRAPYAELRDLLVQLDHHPLAIQLVLPSLRDVPISTIRTEFAVLLPKFVDDTEAGRNRSLLASLEHSLQKLSGEQRVLLSRLVPFQGGASEDDLLVIAEIPEADWLTLRQALEQVALLRTERVHKDIAVPFLHFHPVLVPFLQGQYGRGDAGLLARYVLHYPALAIALAGSDYRRPYAVRALVRRELPNLRRTVDLLIEIGEVEAVSDMAHRIAQFLKIFGLERERDELLQRVTKVVATHTQTDEALTEAEWSHEYDLAENEYDSGNLRAAIDRFTTLLRRIEAQPESMGLGKASYAHCMALYWLARCLSADGQPVAAERRLHDALAIIDALLEQYPDEQSYMRQHGVILAELGDILRAQGRFAEAQKAYEERLKVNEQLGSQRSQAVALTQLGTLALIQRNYAEAQLRYRRALDLFHHLGESQMEAVVWHQQGALAEIQEVWADAERYYRESLAIEERLGNEAGAALTCTQLAMVTERSGRPAEAEGWCKRALGLDERIHPGSPSHARDLNTLARLLLNEVQTGRAPIERLAEARDYAEQALAIRETFDASSEVWVTLSILADIADKDRRVEVARDYRHRERETFAVFAGNRYIIDREFESLIADVVTATNGDIQARGKVEAVLPQLEADGWHITGAIQRVWTGVQDWHSLTEEMDPQDALLILRVPETLASSSAGNPGIIRPFTSCRRAGQNVEGKHIHA